MASDFVIVFSDNQHFGDQQSSLYGTYRGNDHTYNFDCPGIDTSKRAVWYAECTNVHYHNRFTLNGRDIWSLDYPLTGRHVDNSIIPARVLKETGNTLLIEAANSGGHTRRESSRGGLDDFVVDNFVIFYKTKD